MDVGLGPTIWYHRDRPRPLAEVYDEFFDEFILGAAGRARALLPPAGHAHRARPPRDDHVRRADHGRNARLEGRQLT